MSDVAVRILTPADGGDLPSALAPLAHCPEPDERLLWSLAWDSRYLEVRGLDGKPSRKCVFVAECGGRVVGTASLLVERKLIHDGLVAHVEDVSVADGFRGLGAGKRLVAACLDMARDLGCYKAVLSCSAENAVFYRGLGFREHGVSMRIDLGGVADGGQGISGVA